VPAGATPELARVLATSSDDAARVAANRKLTETPLQDDWGVGFSKPLKRALQGQADAARSWRWVGIAGLLAAVLLAATLGRDEAQLLRFGPGLVGLISFLTIGVYAIAQAIERLLEFTVSRVVFRDVPGREADRALILLGIGIALGVIAAVAFDVGLIATVAVTSPEGSWDEAMDALVTGLAVGGGAKPVHDLLTRIRLPLGK